MAAVVFCTWGCRTWLVLVAAGGLSRAGDGFHPHGISAEDREHRRDTATQLLLCSISLPKPPG